MALGYVAMSKIGDDMYDIGLLPGRHSMSPNFPKKVVYCLIL